VWKDYLTLQLVGDAADFLPKAYVDLHFAMFGKTLTGTPQNQERWKRGVTFVTAQLGEAVGALYVAKYFTPDTKAHADQLVKNLLVSMGQRLDALTWMGADTKTKAKEKLATTTEDRVPQEVARLRGAQDRAGRRGRQRRARASSSTPPAREDRQAGRPRRVGMTPMTVNAYYNPVLNEIVFPAAILQPPFFDVSADDAVNYGGIGAVIGHEISHGFDDQGSKFDARGTLKNWWTKEDKAKFGIATAKLVAQYDAYCPVPRRTASPPSASRVR